MSVIISTPIFDATNNVDSSIALVEGELDETEAKNIMPVTFADQSLSPSTQNNVQLATNWFEQVLDLNPYNPYGTNIDCFNIAMTAVSNGLPLTSVITTAAANSDLAKRIATSYSAVTGATLSSAQIAAAIASLVDLVNGELVQTDAQNAVQRLFQNILGRDP